MKWTLLLLAFLYAFSSQAQTLQKCSGKNGVTAYRSGSCMPGEKLVAVRDGTPDTRHVGQLQSQARAPREHQARGSAHAKRQSGKVHRLSTTGPRRKKARKDPCASAKQARDDFQQRRGIKITMAELSRWNHRVYDACK